ncbi:MAG: response regulator [Oscillospiraceae bacterium]|nr:response regulator [Oscillospiraceae bacterium]
MPRAYAVISLSGEKKRILAQSAGFDPCDITKKVTLSDGTELWISGRDELLDVNAQLQRSLQEAQAANAAKENFLSSMSHDIRTPMNAIIGMTALAKSHIDEKSRVADSLSKIETASAHLMNLINEVLDMSRINSGRLDLTEEPFSLSDLLHDTLVIVRPQAAQRKHAFHFQVGEIVSESLYGDPTRLRQIFVNIISNSVKYTNEGGRIDVSVEQRRLSERCQLTFRCRDNGVGMDEEFLRRIFDPFERESTTTLSGVEGTGLGMSIVKSLIDAMTGTIDIESKPGEGTLVTVRMPLRYEPDGVDAAALRERRFLIVEADEEQRAAFMSCLDEFSIPYSLVGSSPEAIAALTDAEFRGERFDAVILGKEQTESAGVFELAEYIHGSNPRLPILLAGEQNWDEIEYRANRCGIERFIPTPFFRKSLVDALLGALQGNDGENLVLATLDLRGKHLLLVEDNAINREIAMELLSVTNAEIDAAENGQLALDSFFGKPEGYYDLILMDVQMPVMDGYSATQRIRASDRADAKTVKIYAMTANAFAEDVAKARESGMDGHIAKPVDLQKLTQVLSRI